jgi:hypothetical protein
VLQNQNPGRVANVASASALQAHQIPAATHTYLKISKLHPQVSGVFEQRHIEISREPGCTRGALTSLKVALPAKLQQKSASKNQIWTFALQFSSQNLG